MSARRALASRFNADGGFHPPQWSAPQAVHCCANLVKVGRLFLDAPQGNRDWAKSSKSYFVRVKFATDGADCLFKHNARISLSEWLRLHMLHGTPTVAKRPVGTNRTVGS